MIKGKFYHVFIFLMLMLEFHVLAQVKILPLGNSITYDNHSNDTRPVEDRIAYRFKLYQLLISAGFKFDYVGSEKAGGNFLPPGFEDNGGFPGITNKQMLDKLKTGYLISYNPDIILLEIGTNGLGADNVETFIGYLNGILNEIDTFEKTASKVVTVFLAQIINRGGSDPSGNHIPTSGYNALMAGLKQNRSTDNIILVNMETGAGIDYRYIRDGGEMYDLYHPVQSGYDKMAVKWFESLEPYLANLPNKAPVLK